MLKGLQDSSLCSCCVGMNSDVLVCQGEEEGEAVGGRSSPEAAGGREKEATGEKIKGRT